MSESKFSLLIVNKYTAQYGVVISRMGVIDFDSPEEADLILSCFLEKWGNSYNVKVTSSWRDENSKSQKASF